MIGRRTIMSAAALVAVVLALALHPTKATPPPTYTANLTGDFYLPPNGSRQVLALPLTAGSYLLTGQLLIGSGDSATTCTAVVNGGTVPFSSQVSTQDAGELAPLPLGGTVTLTGDTLITVNTTCTGNSKAKLHPNTYDETGLASWLTATRLP